MITARAPGKLYVAGEYAVVEPGQPAVLVAVDRYLEVRVEEPVQEDTGHVHSDRYPGAPLTWRREGGALVVDGDARDHVAWTLRTVDRLRAEAGRPAASFDLRISSDLEDPDGRKLGLGSSAAVVVALVAALDELHGLGLSALQRFRLALLATVRVSPRASGGDLAASTFGGWVRYASPDRAVLLRDLDEGDVSAALASVGWHGSDVRPLPSPDALGLLVGWTGSPASTDRLVSGVRGGGARAAASSETFLAASRACVDDLVEALRGDQTAAPDVVRRARRLLRGLGDASGTTIETERLRLLCDVAEEHGAAAKPSGAGGGDCGIALLPADRPTAGILTGWAAHGIRHLDLSPAPPPTRDPR